MVFPIYLFVWFLVLIVLSILCFWLFGCKKVIWSDCFILLFLHFMSLLFIFFFCIRLQSEYQRVHRSHSSWFVLLSFWLARKGKIAYNKAIGRLIDIIIASIIIIVYKNYINKIWQGRISFFGFWFLRFSIPWFYSIVQGGNWQNGRYQYFFLFCMMMIF